MPFYVVITPARNEQDHIARTIESVANQTVRPRSWIIVDDGSTDQTGPIIDAAAADHEWIRVVHRADRGCRKPGGGVVEAFYEGYALVASAPWEYLVKLDGDLSFEPDYFAKCFARFEAQPTLGIGGGTICVEVAGQLVAESPTDPRFHVRGATKIYRRACWEKIGGLFRQTGWDTLDEVKANMLGWNTSTFPDLKVRHYRPTGKADGSWRNCFKNGRANYVTGYHPLFMLAKCLRRCLQKPHFVGPLGLFCGFVSGYLTRAPRIEDKACVRYVRRQQLNRLLLLDSIWQ